MAFQTGTANNTDDFLNKIYAFLQDIGWTLFDSLSATDKVFRSIGVLGNRTIFIRIRKPSPPANKIELLAYSGWDTGSHSGTNEVFHSGYSYITTNDAGSFIYWLYGDKDHLKMVSKIGVSYYPGYVGMIFPYETVSDDPYPFTAIGGSSIFTGNTPMRDSANSLVFYSTMGTTLSSILGSTTPNSRSSKFVAFPIPIYRTIAPVEMRGEFKGVWVVNNIISPEDTITADGLTYRAFSSPGGFVFLFGPEV